MSHGSRSVKRLHRILGIATCLLLCALAQLALAQSIETQRTPPALLFKDAAGSVVTSVPVDKKERLPVVKMQVSSRFHTAYVLNAANKSGERAATAVDLGTQKTRQLIQAGKGKRADLLISQDGRRLFVYTISGKPVLKGIPEEASHFQRSGGSNSLTAIDTSSNRVIGTFDLLHGSGLDVPKAKYRRPLGPDA